MKPVVIGCPVIPSEARNLWIILRGARAEQKKSEMLRLAQHDTCKQAI